MKIKFYSLLFPLLLCIGCINHQENDDYKPFGVIHPAYYYFDNYDNLVNKYKELMSYENPFIFNYSLEGVVKSSYTIEYWPDEVLSHIGNVGDDFFIIGVYMEFEYEDSSVFRLDFYDYKGIHYSKDSCTYYDIRTNPDIDNKFKEDAIVLNENNKVLFNFNFKSKGTGNYEKREIIRDGVSFLYQTFVAKM